MEVLVVGVIGPDIVSSGPGQPNGLAQSGFQFLQIQIQSLSNGIRDLLQLENSLAYSKRCHKSIDSTFNLRFFGSGKEVWRKLDVVIRSGIREKRPVHDRRPYWDSL